MGGLNLGLNTLTTGILGATTVFLVLMAILQLTAYNKVNEAKKLDENNDNRLKTAADKLRVSYILGFIAAGLSLFLGIAYAGHEVLWTPSEWIHTAVFLIVYALLIVSVIYAYYALNDLNTDDIKRDNGASGYIWGSLFLGLFVFMGLSASITGRAGYNVVQNDATKRVAAAESRINEDLPVIRHHVERTTAALQASRSMMTPSRVAPRSMMTPSRVAPRPTMTIPTRTTVSIPTISESIGDLSRGAPLLSPNNF